MTPLIRSRSSVVLLALCIAAPAALAQHTEETPLPPGRWSGTLRPVIMTQSLVAAAGSPGRYEGTVDIVWARNDALVLYRINIRASSTGSVESLEWGVSRGRCGSKLIMLEQANQLPPLEMHGGGTGEVIHDVLWDLDPKASYQVGLFRNGHLQQNMVACANLKYDERGR